MDSLPSYESEEAGSDRTDTGVGRTRCLYTDGCLSISKIKRIYQDGFCFLGCKICVHCSLLLS